MIYLVRISTASTFFILLVISTIPEQISWLNRIFITFRKGRFKGISRLDSNIFCSQIVLAIFNILINNYSRLYKSWLNILSCFGTGFKENQIMFLGKFLAFLCGYFSFELKICFITYEQNNHFGIRIISHIIEPSCQVIKCLSSGNIVY